MNALLKVIEKLHFALPENSCSFFPAVNCYSLIVQIKSKTCKKKKVDLEIRTVEQIQHGMNAAQDTHSEMTLSHFFLPIFEML